MHTFTDTIIPESYVDGGLNGRFSASILFIDISGFTPLTETLFQYGHQGAEILSALLGEVFGEMVCLVYARQGIIPMFAGDGFFAIFPGSPEETAERAWQTAVSIQRRFRSARGPFSLFVTPYGNFSIGVKIGMATGEAAWGILYNDHQTTSYFRGDSLYDSTDAQQTAVTGEIVAHDSILAYLPAEVDMWSADVPAFHKIIPPRLAPPPPPVEKRAQPGLPPVLATSLRNQGNPPPVSPTFRQVCPVFVSFQAENFNWPLLVQQVMTLAEQYGGTFNRLEFGDKGDMMLIWFGAPVSHENNVERAAKFLLALEQETAVPWRAGLAYGLVWAGNRGGEAYSEYGCVGDALNTAARIVSQAQWGQIWLDETVARELNISYVVQSLGEFQFKGKQKPKSLFRLMGMASSVENLPVTGLVGRQQEMTQCREALAPIFNGRFAGIITIQGEAGIGKSYFSGVLRQQLEGQTTWLTCPADDILRESLNPFQTMLTTHFKQLVEQETSENWKQFIDQFNGITAKLMDVADERGQAVYAELHRTQTTLARLAGISLGSVKNSIDPALRFSNSLLALTAFLQAQALIKPVVLHIEDAHWLDDESWQFVVDIPRRLAGFPIVLLVTGRPDGPFSVRFKPETAVFHTRIALQPFKPAEIQDMCRLLLGKPVTEAIVSFLHGQSQGNPFFVQQLVFELRQQGFFTIGQMGETAVFTLVDADQQILPKTLTALLTSRLDRLSEPVKMLVQRAAVLGQLFSLALLAAMCPDDEELLAKIQEAAQQDIWQGHTESRVRFQHALLRDVAYTMQPESQRSAIHYQAALTLESISKTDLVPNFREIAHHYHAAYKNGMLSARKSARHYLRLAGEQAARMYENETAVSYFSTALTLSVRETKKFPLHLAREDIYHLQGKRTLQAQDLAILTSIAQNQGDSNLLTTVALRVARYAEALGDYAQSAAEAQRALSYASTPLQAAEAHLQWGLALVPTGAYQEATQQLQKALVQAEQTEQYDLQSKALINLGNIAFLQGDYQEAVRSYHRVLALCHASGDKQMEGAVLNDLGEVSRFQNDLRTAVTHLNAALTIAQEIGDRRTESRVLKNLGDIAGALYQFEEARENFSRDLQISREIGDLDGEGQALGNLGYVEVILSNYAQAEAYIQQNLDIAQQTGNRHNEVVALSLLGWCENMRHKWADAATHFERGQQLAAGIGDQEIEMYCWGGLGNALVGMNRVPEGAWLLRKSAVGYRVLRMEVFALESMAGWIRAQLILGNAAGTRPVLEEMLDYLYTVGPFIGADAPLRMLWTCYQALLANADDRAQPLLEKTVDLLKTAVSHIPDEPTRNSFLENVSWHREIMLASLRTNVL